jgi:hypothetical protein
MTAHIQAGRQEGLVEQTLVYHCVVCGPLTDSNVSANSAGAGTFCMQCCSYCLLLCLLWL